MRDHDRRADWSGAELNLAAHCADHFVCRGQLCVRDCGALGRSRAQDTGRASIRVRRLQVLGPHRLLPAVSAPPQPALAAPRGSQPLACEGGKAEQSLRRYRALSEAELESGSEKLLCYACAGKK